MTPFTLPYLHFDVFTGAPFEGNQLAVFLDTPDIPAELMQRIAAEMAFSESTFVFPPEGPGDVRMRIFTPGEELPMAGHPTIGTTFALAHEGRIPHGRETFVFELGVGPIEVALEWDARALSFAWMTQLVPTFGPAASNPDAFLASAGVDPSDVHPGLPAQVVSCGLPFLFLPLRTRAAVDAVQIDKRALGRAFDAAGIDEVPLFVFTTGPGAGDETAYSRMLAPGFGISEDPATGSASGPLGCYMLQHGLITAAEARRIVSLQGVAMGRPSRIHISIDSDNGRITRVRVGGEAVLVGRGEILLAG
jgi:trans-2,3-dihydro-3-hydroxyanthranilate isomerase